MCLGGYDVPYFMWKCHVLPYGSMFLCWHEQWDNEFVPNTP